MAKKLPKSELERMKTDFDPPKIPPGQTSLFEDKKNFKKKLSESLSVKFEKKPTPEKPPKVGRPPKPEKVDVRSFRLPERTVRRLRVRAALDGVSAADIIIKLVDKMHVPGLDK